MAADQETGLSFLFDTAYRYQPDFHRYVSNYVELLKFDNPSMDENQMMEAQQNLRVEFYRLCLQSIGIASFDSLLIMDYNGILLEINTIAEKTLGLKRSKVLGQPFFAKLFPDLQIEEYLDWIKQNAASGDSLTRKSTEVLMVKANGTIFPAEIKVTEMNIFGSALLVLCFNDITRRKWMDQALKYTEERYRKIMGENADAIFLVDPFNKRIEESNPAFNIMMGYNDDELFALRLYDVLDGDPERIDEWVEMRLRKGTSLLLREQGKFKTRNQHLIDVEYTTSVFDLRDHPILCIIMRDTTPREFVVKRSLVDDQIDSMQRNLDKLNARLDELEKTKLNKAQKEILEEMQEFGALLKTELVRDDSDKAEEFPLAKQKIPFNFKAAVFHVHSLFRKLLKKKNLPLEISFDSNVPDILIGDPLSLQEIFFHILDNAIRMTQEGDVLVQIRVTEIKHSTANVLFSLRDAGGGMDPVTKAKVSDVLTDEKPLEKGRQYQVRGLAICGHYVQALEGKIRFNTLEGKGTSFIFSLPFETTSQDPVDLPELTLEMVQAHLEQMGESMHSGEEGFEEQLTVFDLVDEEDEEDQAEWVAAAAAAASQAAVSAATAPVASEAHPLRVMLVEHDVDHAIDIQSQLQGQNVEMRMVDNGRKALELIQEQDFELVLMGLDLPIMDGKTAAVGIREWEQKNRKSAVLMLAFAPEPEPDELQQEFDRYLTSPFNAEQTVEIIHWARQELGSRQAATQAASPRAESAPPVGPAAEPVVAPISEPMAQPAAVDPLGGLDPGLDLFADLESELETQGAEADAGGSAERIPVKLSADMAKLAPDFLAKRQKDVDKIDQALRGAKLDSVRVLGKSMKGTGAVYGFDIIAEIGKDLEEAATNREHERLRQSLEQLKDFLERVEILVE